MTFKSTNQRSTFESSPVDRIVNYTVTGQLTRTLRARVAGSNERQRGPVGLPNIQTDGTSTSNPALFPSATRFDSFNDAISGSSTGCRRRRRSSA